jgi:citronellol/citronellal dehydrogenase
MRVGACDGRVGIVTGASRGIGQAIAGRVRAPDELTQLVVPGIRRRRRGWILNITSRAGTHPVGSPFEEIHVTGGFSAYGMCKAALDRFTTAGAGETYRDGIAINSLGPWDTVATPGPGTHDLVKNLTLEGPEWMAEAALALCSCEPRLTGRIAYSQPLLAELRRRPRPPTLIRS